MLGGLLCNGKLSFFDLLFQELISQNKIFVVLSNFRESRNHQIDVFENIQFHFILQPTPFFNGYVLREIIKVNSKISAKNLKLLASL